MEFSGTKRAQLTKKMAIDCPGHRPCLELAYIDLGSGEPLVLIHGLGGNAWSWKHQLQELSQFYRVVAMDLRGHGQSANRPEEAVTIRVFASDIIALVKGLGLEQAYFCGNSLGGMLAMEIWVRSPALMKSLTLVDTTAFFPPPHILEEFLHLFDHMEMAAWGRFMAPRLLQRGASVDLIEQVAGEIAATNRAAYRQGLVAAFLADYRWALPAMEIPTLILVGEEDQSTPIGYARYLHSQIKNSKLLVLANAAHLSHRENPQAFNRCLRERLQGL